jgi:hypothetical protein
MEWQLKRCRNQALRIASTMHWHELHFTLLRLTKLLYAALWVSHTYEIPPSGTVVSIHSLLPPLTDMNPLIPQRGQPPFGPGPPVLSCETTQVLERRDLSAAWAWCCSDRTSDRDRAWMPTWNLLSVCWKTLYFYLLMSVFVL